MAANEKRERLTDEALVTVHALAATSTGSWVVDSGATCHMCSDENMFVDLTQLNAPQRVTLGDGSSLEGPAKGTVILDRVLPNGRSQKCRIVNVLYVPMLYYSLLSVSKVSEAGKITKFNRTGCEILEKGSCYCYQSRQSVLPGILQEGVKSECS